MAAFTTRIMRENSRRGCPYKFSVMYLVDTRPCEYARNVLVTRALDRKDIDAIWFMDSDMIPSENSFELLGLPGDIIGGIAPIFNDNSMDEPSFTFNLYGEAAEGPTTDRKMYRPFAPIMPKNSKPIEVHGIGSSCMIIYRHVLADKRLWLSDERDDGIVPLFRWPKSVSGKTTGTDDLDFCLRAREHGYKIIAHPGVRWGHIKSIDLDWILKKVDFAYRQGEARNKQYTTVNDFNEENCRRALKAVRQESPSGEAGSESADSLALISPTAAN
jgi:hypothetical protein